MVRTLIYCIIHEQLLVIYKYIYIPLHFHLPKFVDTDSTTIADLINKPSGIFNSSDVEEMDALVMVPAAEMIAVSNKDKCIILSKGDLAALMK